MAGFWDSVLQRVLPPSVFTPRETFVGSYEPWRDLITDDLSGSSPAALYRKQPHLRTVVSFVSRNIAQLGVHSFERVSETDRARDRTSTAARALRDVDGHMTTYELLYALVGDLLLYDRGYWFVGASDTLPSGWMIRRLPPSWVSVDDHSPFEVKSYRVSWGDQKSVKVDASQVLSFTGYDPTDPIKGSSAVEALKATLQEQIEAAAYRTQVWKRGGRVSSVLERPAGSPAWTDPQRERFREDWYAKFTGRGSSAGGTPILEDGMTLKRIDFNAQEQQFVEAAKLSMQTVASAFHVNPTMIGDNTGANYSNVREFRRMLYGDTLGPILAQIEARLNTFLLPMLGVDPDRFYVEFNIAEKLQGSFEEQAAAMQSATGAPWMTRSEARARMNLPAVAGADDLVVPLNVLVGGQASSQDSGSQNRNAALPPRRKARAAESERDALAEVLRKFFARQERVVRGAMGAKSADWWDAERWDSELADDLYRYAVEVSQGVAEKTLDAIGFGPDAYDVDRTLAWLREVSQRSAGAINETTLQRIHGSSGADEVDQVFASQEARADQIATANLTLISSFATVEAGRQVGGDNVRKTWVTGSNPRPEHARMNGQTVGIDEKFSNGALWPGDGANLGADNLAGCNCSLAITVEGQ